MLCPFDTLQMKRMLLHYIYFLCFVLLIPYKWSIWYFIIYIFCALSFWYLTNEAYGTSLYIFSVLRPFDTLQMKRMLLHYIYFLCFVLLIPYKWSIWYFIIYIFCALSFWYLTNEAYGTSLSVFSMLCPFDTLQMKRMVLRYIYFLCFVLLIPYKWSVWYFIICIFYALSFWYLTNEAYGTPLSVFSMLCPFDTLQNEAPLYIFSMLCPYKWSV